MRRLRCNPSIARSTPIHIAVPEFLPGGPADAEEAYFLTGIITTYLRRSGEFKLIAPSGAIAKITDLDAVPSFADWKASNADFLILGRIAQHDRRLQAGFRLWSVAAGGHLMGQKLASTSDDLPQIGYMIANHVYVRLTGEKCIPALGAPALPKADPRGRDQGPGRTGTEP